MSLLHRAASRLKRYLTGSMLRGPDERPELVQSQAADGMVDLPSKNELDAQINLSARDRFELWSGFIRSNGLRQIAEIGVYRGEFAKQMLREAPDIERYWMIDPWRAIRDWNKPANTNDAEFEAYFTETLNATEFASRKRIVLRGKTTEVIDNIDDGALDFIYVDGDHTLRGITIDLIQAYPKLRDGGWLTGDDFCNSIWQHPRKFEPTLVFPFAVHFAEANDLRIYALPYRQFAMQRGSGPYGFTDLTGTYGDLGLMRQLSP